MLDTRDACSPIWLPTDRRVFFCDRIRDLHSRPRQPRIAFIGACSHRQRPRDPTPGFRAGRSGIVHGMQDRPELHTHSCGRCGASWFGLLRCHCAAWHQIVDEYDLYNTHRFEGSCLDPVELSMVRNKGRVWEKYMQVRVGRRR